MWSGTLGDLPLPSPLGFRYISSSAAVVVEGATD